MNTIVSLRSQGHELLLPIGDGLDSRPRDGKYLLSVRDEQARFRNHNTRVRHFRNRAAKEETSAIERMFVAAKEIRRRDEGFRIARRGHARELWPGAVARVRAGGLEPNGFDGPCACAAMAVELDPTGRAGTG